ncbi:polo-like kinase 1 [Nematocida sp. AWRm77]|nr:polo-like kinase 1 [Nematocida sp. AWRm77]
MKRSPPFLPIGSFIYDRDTLDSFEITGLIGQGGFAQCFSVRKVATGEEFAAKIIKKSELVRPKNKQKLLSEIKIHLSVTHKNIVKLYTYFEDKSFVFLIMEICHNKSMMDLLRKSKVIEEKYVRVFLLQIVSALEYLHKECSVVHRDMKLANLFLDENFNIKVGDFGLAAVIDKEERKKTICGTPNYIAPEVLFNSTDGHSFEVDIWSVGVILYTMIVGKPPFQKSDVKEIYRSIKTNSYTYDPDCKISNSAKKLISGLLELDPKKRLTLGEISNSEFIREIEVPCMPAKSEIRTVPGKDVHVHARGENIPQPSETKTYASSGCTAQAAQAATVLAAPATAPLVAAAAAATTASASASVKAGLLASVHKSILSLLERHAGPVPLSTECMQDYIVHTADCTSKYGLGYLLASGTLGILFNDGTSIVLRKSAVEVALRKENAYYFEYFEHKQYGVQKIITKERHFAETAARRMEKKVLLVQYFASVLFATPHTFVPTTTDNAFVIKHVQFPRGPVFRMSNRSIIFVVDGKILVFSNEGSFLFAEKRKTIDREVLMYCHDVLVLLLKK